MEHRYRKLMRKVKSYLLWEQRKDTKMGWFVRKVGMKIYNEHYWKWERRGVSLGAGWGAAAAVCPLPLQTLWGILACLWKKGNIPVAVLMAWTSPPFFMLFFTPVQWWLGNVMVRLTGLDGSRASVEMVERAVWGCSWEPLAGVNIYVGLFEYALGLVVSCSLIGLAAYGCVQGLWALFGRKK